MKKISRILLVLTVIGLSSCNTFSSSSASPSSSSSLPSTSSSTTPPPSSTSTGPVANLEELINEDIANYANNMFANRYRLNLPAKGAVNSSKITWSFAGKYVSKNGFLLSVPPSDNTTSVELTGLFQLENIRKTHTFSVPVGQPLPVEIAEVKEVDYTNLNTEYLLPDQTVSLLFEADESVPYIKVVDFFNLLKTGLIDDKYDLAFVTDEGILTISYDYYDEDFDELYHLILTIDTNDNTISTNDPGFYWAYVTSPETNYSRHINNDLLNEDNYFEDGVDVVYNLNDYGLDLAMYEDEVVMPYFLANQLFAGTSYFNVYYNGDGLFGIYASPSSDSEEYETMKTSSLNGQNIPDEMVIHNFSMLAFALDNFYGLKEVKGITDYYDWLLNERNNLLVNNPQSFDNSLQTLLFKKIDEPHTSYGYPSYYNSLSWEGPTLTKIAQLGTRVRAFYENGIWAVQDEIAAKWGSLDNRPDYWFLNNETAVLTLDGFDTMDLTESSVYDESLAKEVLKVDNLDGILPSITTGDKFFYYNFNSQTEHTLQVLVKNVPDNYPEDYEASLLGWTFDDESGVYSKNEYTLQIDYQDASQLFLVEITDSQEVNPLKIDDTVFSDSAVYMEVMLEAIFKEHPTVTDILLDLSYNTGGNIGALYRVVGFITDEPFRVSNLSQDTKSASSHYLYIDGIPNYKDVNWSILISPVTFSAGNALATIFQENNLGPIIGLKSGGGAASITPILLPIGTSFIMSSNSLTAYRTGIGTPEDPFVFHDVEFGIDPTAIIAMEEIYDDATLLAALAS